MMDRMENVIGQHAEEAAFLAVLRDSVVIAPHVRLRDVAALDERLEAHLDGLRIAGDEGWLVVRGQLADGEAGEVFSAAVLAFDPLDYVRVSDVLASAGENPDLARAVTAAVARIPPESGSAIASDFLRSAEPVWRRAGVAACTILGQFPGDLLGQLLYDRDPLVRARSLRAAGELGLMEYREIASRACSDENAECRFWGAWTSVRLGDREVCPLLCGRAESPMARRATVGAVLAARAMPLAHALDWHGRLRDAPLLRRIAIQVAGAIGDPCLVPWLIDQMIDSASMRCAGEAFTLITGADLAAEGIEQERPAAMENVPNDDAEDDRVEMDPDERLAFPAAASVRKWWSQQEGRFVRGARYLLGQPVSEESAWDVLRNGRQRQRSAAALELGLLHPDRPLFEVRALAALQFEMLGTGNS
jgi:uncharacterized protein (TIGR02270 family)